MLSRKQPTARVLTAHLCLTDLAKMLSSASPLGVVGGMKETGWQASHGPGDSGLTYQVLGDITWAFWKTLHSSLRWFLGRELTIVESSSLAEMIAGCQGKLIELWLETVNNR